MKRKNEDVEHICAHCENSVVICESEICICRIKGAVSQSGKCKKFSLDLLKIAPMPKVIPEDETVFFDI